jgi:hypothetical protein
MEGFGFVEEFFKGFLVGWQSPGLFEPVNIRTVW